MFIQPYLETYRKLIDRDYSRYQHHFSTLNRTSFDNTITFQEKVSTYPQKVGYINSVCLQPTVCFIV